MNALSKQETRAPGRGVVYVRDGRSQAAREFGTIPLPNTQRGAWRSHYVPVFPEHIRGKTERSRAKRDRVREAMSASLRKAP